MCANRLKLSVHNLSFVFLFLCFSFPFLLFPLFKVVLSFIFCNRHSFFFLLLSADADEHNLILFFLAVILF